jgi:hypothetical protein
MVLTSKYCLIGNVWFRGLLCKCVHSQEGGIFLCIQTHDTYVCLFVVQVVVVSTSSNIIRRCVTFQTSHHLLYHYSIHKHTHSTQVFIYDGILWCIILLETNSYMHFVCSLL